MTKPRLNPHRELYGIIGKVPNAGHIQSVWNRYFAEQGRDAFMDKYPTTVETLPERLSEMFHFDRRAYLVGEDLREGILPLLDLVEGQPVNLIENRNGVFVGLYTKSFEPEDVVL